MDIKEIKKEKSILDEGLGDLIRNFEEKTNVRIVSIEIERLPMYTGLMNQGGLVVYTEVRI